ncbi:MAG TPA: oligosaccharide flippase family protein [Polyangiaceae bacterium]|nr:oligosaccharide flippase family protein [Polyangiaceae bacterium]
MAASHSEQAGVLVLGKILATLSEAIVPLAIVRLLGKADVGILSGLLLVYSTVALVLTAGFPETLTFYLPTRPPAERKAIAGKVAQALLLLGLLGALVLLGISLLARFTPHWLSGMAAEHDAQSGVTSLKYLALLAVYPIADLPGRMLPNLLIVEQRAKAAAGVGIVKAIGSAVAAVLPIALGAPLWVVILSIGSFGFVFGAVLVYFIRALYPGVPAIESPIPMKTLLRFGLPLGLTDIVSMLNNQLDRYLIVFFFPVTAVAEYQAGAWQIPIIMTIPYTVGAVYAPRFVELFKTGRNQEAIDIWRQSALKAALLVVPITMVFVVASEETMELLFTRSYLRAAPVFRWYCILTLGRIATFGSVILAAGAPRLIFQAAVFSLVSNAILCSVLVKWVGFNGPAMGTALAFIPSVAYYCVCIAAATKLSFRNIFPLVGFLRVLGLSCLASLPAWWFKSAATWPAAARLPMEALLVLGTFALLGTLVGEIRRADWAFLGNWLRLRMLRES